MLASMMQSMQAMIQVYVSRPTGVQAGYDKGGVWTPDHNVCASGEQAAG